jgi:hypothetical protein
MQDYTIKVYDDSVKYAFELFLENGKVGIAQFVNSVLQSGHGLTDAAVIKNADGVYEIHKTAPDKGWVLSKNFNYDGGPLELIQYAQLDAGAKYVLFETDKLTLYVKEPEGHPDLKLGHFPSLSIAADQIEGDDVKNAVEQALARRDNERKEQEKLERAEKLRKLAKNETTQPQLAENAE